MEASVSIYGCLQVRLVPDNSRDRHSHQQCWHLRHHRQCGITLLPVAADQTSRWWHDLNVNVRGTMLVTKHFVHLTGMKERATLLHMSSVAGLMTTVPGNRAYDISELADLQLAAFAALKNSNVTAIAFYPGINTDLPCRRCQVLPSFRKGYARIGWRGY
jgi:NAD(P)-dependent dehydrogenase (short-subunit alcohol dehydrogenase family)